MGLAHEVARELLATPGRYLRYQRQAGLLNVPVVIAAVTLFGLQLRYPVSRPSGARSYATSAGWYLLNGVLAVSVFAAQTLSLLWLFRGPLSFMTLDAGRSWPVVVRVVLLLVVSDALGWWLHRLYHSVPLLWRFHRLHHSADHMSFWVTGRAHPVDSGLGIAVSVVLVGIAGETVMVLGALTLVQLIQVQLLHTNLRLRLGRIDALVTTPQWHRLHHSTRPEHNDRNFGTMFTMWDRVFGTATVPGRDDFPAVGLDIESHPPDADRLRDVPRVMAQQFIFPFRGLRSSRPPTFSPAGPVTATTSSVWGGHDVMPERDQPVGPETRRELDRRSGRSGPPQAITLSGIACQPGQSRGEVGGRSLLDEHTGVADHLRDGARSAGDHGHA